MSLKSRMNKENLLKHLLLFCIVTYVSVSSFAQDPYHKKISIPKNLKNEAQLFLQSHYDKIIFSNVHSSVYGYKKCDECFEISLPSEYLKQERISYQEREVFKTTETYVTYDNDSNPRTGTRPKYTESMVTHYRNVNVPNNEADKIKYKLESQKKYNSAIKTIKQYGRFDDKNVQDSVKLDIKSKYSNKEYKKYLGNEKQKLKWLKKEWKTVPLTDKEIKAQTRRVQASWRNFRKEKSNAIQLFDLQCKEVFEAKRFAYKYEQNIP